MYGCPLHGLEVRDRVEKRAGDVAHVDEVPLRVPFEDDQRAVGDGAIDEVVHEQVEPHSRREAKDGREAEGERVTGVEYRSSASTFVRPYRLIGRSGLSSVQSVSFVADAVAAIRVREDYALLQ